MKPAVIGLDSNIFIYFLEANPEFYAAATRIFERIEQKQLTAIASEMVYLEVLADSNLSLAQVRVLESGLRDLLPFAAVTEPVLFEAARLRREYQLGALDAVHVASAVVAECEQFVTNDRQLLSKRVKGIELVALADFRPPRAVTR